MFQIRPVTRSPCSRSSSSSSSEVFLSPATSASASVQTLRSAEVAQDSSTSSAPMLAPGAVLHGELLELSQQPLLAVADLRDQQLRAVLVEVELEAVGLLDHPLREIPGLDVHLGGDLPAGLLDRLVELVGRLVAALLAGEERDRQRLGVGARERRGDLVDVALLPALDAVGDHEAPAHGEGHRGQRADDVLRRALLVLVELDARGARGGLGHRAQAGAPLGDPAVVIAVDQVGGAEAGHAVRVLRRSAASWRGAASCGAPSAGVRPTGGETPGRHVWGGFQPYRRFSSPPMSGLRRGRRQRERQRLAVAAGAQALGLADRLLEAELHVAVGDRRVPRRQRQRAVVGPQRRVGAAVGADLQRRRQRVRAVDEPAGGRASSGRSRSARRRRRSTWPWPSSSSCSHARRPGTNGPSGAAVPSVSASVAGTVPVTSPVTLVDAPGDLERRDRRVVVGDAHALGRVGGAARAGRAGQCSARTRRCRGGRSACP